MPTGETNVNVSHLKLKEIASVNGTKPVGIFFFLISSFYCSVAYAMFCIYIIFVLSRVSFLHYE